MSSNQADYTPLASEENSDKKEKSNNIAVRVQNLSKCYQIYDKPRDRLKQMLIPRFQRSIGQSPKQYYREFWALKDVSFEINKGETVGIIGRNGSGKSTLLQMICGTLSPSNGTVLTNGRIAALLELGSGFNPLFTGRENVYMNAAVLGLSKKEVDERFDSIAAFADIGQFIEQPVKTYSSGMAVRLAFAVAINVDPQILVVDEALSVGDELFKRKCFSRIEAIKNNGATILFVSHAISTINQLCNEAILIHCGNVLLRGNPRTVTKHYHQLLFSKAGSENEVIASIKAGRMDDTITIQDNELHGDYLDDYIEGLAVAAPLKYEKQGGEILSFEMHDAQGKKVNIVSTGFSGLVKLIVRFDAPFQNVTFGFHLKSVSGLEVAGLSYPPPQGSVVSVVPGDTVEVCWKVYMPLAAGTYFCSCGVRSVGEGGFIDRIVDGAVVKVIAKSNPSSFGIVDISNESQCWAKKI